MARGTSELLMRARILLAAFKARRAAAAVMFVVAVLAIAAAAIGPMFLKSADTSVLTSAVNAAPPGQTDLTFFSNGGAPQMSKLSSAARAADGQSGGLLSPSLFTADVGSHFVFKGQQYAADILARSSICAHLTFLEGSCPHGVNEVAISERSAAASDLGVGARLRISVSHTSTTIGMTVTAIYRSPSTVDDSYWKDENYFDYGTGGPPVVELDPLVATFATVIATYPVAEPQLSADLAWRAGATLSGASALEATVVKVKSDLFSHYGIAASTGLTSVINATRLDDNLMSTVVLAIVLQLVLLALLILYTLGRSTLLGRRQESEFARRHGFPRSALIALAVGEPATLIVVALPVGILLAWGALAVLTKTLFIAGTPASFPGAAIAFAVGTCAAGVAAMTIASSQLWRSRSLNNLQVTLLSVAVDAFALALALTGLIALVTRGSLSGAHADPLAALAPGLLALGAGVIGLRLAALVIRAVIARSGESSRVAWFLALRQIGRRPSVLRQLLPLTAATAVLLFAVGSFFLASSNRSLVAHFDVGAARVVDVTPPPLFNLEAAVRRADPSGREAMAVTYYSSPTGELLAVDTSRLAAVGVWPSALAPESLAALARQLSPRVPPGVSFSGDALRLTLGVAKGTPRMELGVNIYGETDQDNKTLFVGPILAGVHSYTVALDGVCTATCRLTGLAPNWVNPFNPYSKKVKFVLRGVAEQDGGQWRNVAFGAGHKGTWDAQPSSVRIEAPGHTCCDVTFEIPGVQLQSTGLILSPVDLPTATPAIVSTRIEITDPPVPPRGNLTLNLDGSLLTVHPLTFVSTLPLLGDHGALVDYVFAQRALTRRGNDTTYQVWLTPSASPAILQRLRADGVAIGPIALASTRLGALDHSGIALAYTVALFVAPIAALLAIGTVSFIIVLDGRRRRRDFVSLSLDGVPRGTVRRALLVENGVVLGVALVIGAAVGFATDTLAFASLPEFAAGTGGLPISKAVPITPFLGAVGILALLLVGAVELTTRTVMRGDRSRRDGGSAE
jgi:putative ABC transport system permease protein